MPVQHRNIAITPELIAVQSTEKKGLQQYFLLETEGVEALLATIDFGKRKVIEIGVGAGFLTQLIAAQVGYDRIIGFEIDKDIVPEGLAEKMTLHIGDVREADLSFLNGGDYILVANPPYYLIPWILEEILNRHPTMPAIMLYPGGKDAPPGWVKRVTISPEGFHRPTKIEHWMWTWRLPS